MFEIPAEETIQLAAMQGLQPLLNLRTESSQEQNRIAGVTWTNLAFVKGNGQLGFPSLRANGSRECAPDDRLREAIHSTA
jgi:hypothetical protein